MTVTLANGMMALLAGLLVAPPSGNHEPRGSGAIKAGETRFRRPGALAASEDGSRLFVANRGSGSLSVIDPIGGRVIEEVDIAKGLGDLTPLPDGRLAAVDRDGGLLLILRTGEGPVVVESRCPVGSEPSSVLASPDGKVCVVGSTASRRLSIISLRVDPVKGASPTVDRLIPLPFAPGLLAWAEPGKLLVAADAFGGRIALVDPTRDRPDSVRSIPAHNIRGLARTPDGRSLIVAHQTLSRQARTSFEDIHWGSLMGNHLRILELSSVIAPDGDLLKGSRLVDLGQSGRAAGDPGALAFDREGRLAVALVGVHEVALLADPRSSIAARVRVGRGPSAVLASADGSRIYVAEAGDDSVSVVDVATATKVRSISLGPRPEADAVERGRLLFADAQLSHDGWMSCQSCHTDGRSNGRSVDTLSDGGFGAPKQVSSLLGVGSTGPWTWLGTIERLEDQVRKSVETTMRGRPPTLDQVSDLTAYLRSLEPQRPVVAEGVAAEQAVDRGKAVFRARKCAECHAPPAYTSEGVFEVGLVDEVGHRAFNPPSLRGIGDRGPFLHDGRAPTLPDVFLRHRHPRGSSWAEGEVDDLTAFLRSL